MQATHFIKNILNDKSHQKKVIDSFDNIIIRDANKLMLKELINE